MTTYQKENNLLLKSFLDRTFFEAWKNKDDERLINFSRIEFYLTAKCNLACKYCYLARFGEELFPEVSPEVTLQKTAMLIDWLIENNYAPDVDFFSGGPITKKVSMSVLDMTLEKFSKAKNKPRFIVVPTNYTFILNDKSIDKVETILKKGKELGIPVLLSASFDGKYCEDNRPFKSGIDIRDDKYYDKCFQFASKHHFGFHPMVYSENIEHWIDNFLWFQSNFKKFNIPFDNIYLLEVRNVEWTNKQIKSYMEFIEFLIKWTFQTKLGENIDNYTKFVFQHRGFNILSNPLTTIGRGLGCSLQSILYVRLSDLTIVPCHRQSYEQFVSGRFVVENNKIVDIKANNLELLIGEVSFEFKNQPQCETCVIRYLCQGQCLGSMYEVNGDMFSPIPSVCKLFHAKILAMIRIYKKLGLYESILSKVSEQKRIAFKLINKLGGFNE